MSSAGEVLQQDDVTGPDPPDLPITHFHLEVATKVEVELATRAGMPVAEPASRELKEQRTLRRDGRRDIERWRGRSKVARLQLDVDVLEVRGAVAVGPDAGDPHDPVNG